VTRLQSHIGPGEAGFEGKTYSLRPDAAPSNEYFEVVRQLTDSLLTESSDGRHVLSRIQSLSRRRRTLRKLKDAAGESPDARLVSTLHTHLHSYTPGVAAHLRSLRGLDRFSRALSMSEGQYHLAMIEIELVNRIHAGSFRSSTTKYAFLPHCLRDLSADCRSAERDVDYVCKGCSDGCNINRVSKTLRRLGVKPYIWMTADLKSLFRGAEKKGERLGVVGIACVPELMRGMRMCMKHNVPVVGIPLDANRCARWWGEFFWNTVNVTQLERLIC
jgi:hypothetical protein